MPRIGYRVVTPQAGGSNKEGSPPAIAVLPFENLSSDPERSYLADGVVEDLITALSRFKTFSVVARNSTFVYKGRAVDVRDVARDLGVRYVEGSVRRSGDKVRVTAHLYAGNLDDYFFLAASSALLGRVEEAHTAMKAVLALRPDFTITMKSRGPVRFPERRKLLIDGLRLAGMPEG